MKNLTPLKYKDSIIPGFFISDEGKIYDENGIEQELKLHNRYYRFKGRFVHLLMCHSYFGYKEGYDVHHLNECKTDNQLSNLVYLTRENHRKLHHTGKKHHLGKKLSAESKQKISVANKGKKRSEQTKQKIRAANVGKKRSEQTKQKIRATRKKKQVYCVELDKVFESIHAAARELYLNPRNICGCCKGQLKSAGAFHFEYFN